LGLKLQAPAGLGRASFYRDEEYRAAGVEFTTDHHRALGSADLVLRVRQPPLAEVALMKRGAVHLSFFDPFTERELIGAFTAAGVAAVSIEMIPRTSLARKWTR
jgi:NAD(P) transhydrogenase subunit alpha